MKTAPRLPAITLTVVALSVLAYCLPGTAAIFEYNREAILSGEWWRLLTGHWIHFSTSHFLYDTTAFAIAGCLIEGCGYKNFGWLCVGSTMVIGTAMLIFEPNLYICGGLSGMATAFFFFLALHGLEEKGAWRSFCMMLLILCTAKLIIELATGKLLFVNPSESFVPVPINHVAGAFTAIILWTWSNRKFARRRLTLPEKNVSDRSKCGDRSKQAQQYVRTAAHIHRFYHAHDSRAQ